MTRSTTTWTKAAAQHAHAAKRFAERYGRVLSADEFDEIERTVRRALKYLRKTGGQVPKSEARMWREADALARREAVLETSARGTRQHWRVQHGGQTVRLVWDAPSARIVTFLPPDSAGEIAHHQALRARAGEPA